MARGTELQGNTRIFSLVMAQAIEKFLNLQQQEDDEIKSIATNLAYNEMKLNKWTGDEKEWEQVYKTVWVEKLMFVQMTYDVSQILNLSRQLLAGQKKLIAFAGIIISNTGEILKNQEVIITNQGLILDVTGQILENVEDIKDMTEEILATNYEILGTVKDIQGDVKDMKANGVKVIWDDYTPGTQKIGKYLGIVAGILGAIILLVIVLRLIRKRK